MITVIVGGSGSGKSEYAESLLKDYSGKKIYLATMQVFDEDGQRKVERHRKLRAGKGFETVEKTRDVGELDFECGGTSAVLLECMSNLVANEMFGGEKDLSCEPDLVSQKVLREVKILAEKIDELVIVTNNVAEDGIEYDCSTMAYIKALSDVNVGLAGIADIITEVVVGIPIPIREGK